MLSTAEILVGFSRHLGTYAFGRQRAAFGGLEFGGQVLELALRLRGSGVSPMPRVSAIAADAGISDFQLEKQHLPTLEALGWIERFEKDGVVSAVSETIPPYHELFESADLVLDVVAPRPVERAAVKMLDTTVTMPVTRERALELGAATSTMEAAKEALSHLDSLNLVAIEASDEGLTLVYNPHIWGVDSDFAEAALKCEDGRVYRALNGLMEEVGASPGLPQAHVTSADKRWIDFAVAKGLISRSLVITSEGREEAFLFTPHMGRNAFGDSMTIDPSGHVRQLIGSMMYARNFAHFKLRTPDVFLRNLIREGEAGDASPIGSDYPMLETAGIVRVEPADRFYKLVLLQSDVAEAALDHLMTASASIGDRGRIGLRDQRQYVYPEQEAATRRVALGKTAGASQADTSRLLAAVRQTAREVKRG